MWRLVFLAFFLYRGWTNVGSFFKRFEQHSGDTSWGGDIFAIGVALKAQ